MSGLLVRAITITVKIGKGSYGNSGYDTVTLAGLRVSCRIEKNGPPSMNNAQIRVFGLTLALMNQLSTLGIVWGTRNDEVLIEAGDATNGMALVFAGTVKEAYADMSSSPETSFVMVCYGGALSALRPIPPTSFNGQADVAVVMAGLANQANIGFRNFGVTGVFLSYPYLDGTARQQIVTCAEHAHIHQIIDAYGGGETLSIYPWTGHRGDLIPLISPATGMVGYPAYAQAGPVITALYNPVVSFGALIQVQSSITPASNNWRVYRLVYDLASQTPGGPWFMTMSCELPDGGHF